MKLPKMSREISRRETPLAVFPGKTARKISWAYSPGERLLQLDGKCRRGYLRVQLGFSYVPPIWVNDVVLTPGSGYHGKLFLDIFSTFFAGMRRNG